MINKALLERVDTVIRQTSGITTAPAGIRDDLKKRDTQITRDLTRLISKVEAFGDVGKNAKVKATLKGDISIKLTILVNKLAELNARITDAAEKIPTND